MSDWPEKLQGGLVAWQRSQPHLAANAMLEALALLPMGPDSDLWRVLILSHLSLIMVQGSGYEEATTHHERAQQIWRQSGLVSDEALRPNVEWFAGLLRTAGLDLEAEQLLTSLSKGEPLVVDLWGGSGSLSMLALGSQQGSRVQGSAERAYEPLGGRRLEASVSTQEMPALLSWETGITDALRLVSRDKCRDAIRRLEEVRRAALEFRSKDLGLRLLFTHNAEVLTYFFVGDYPASDRARNEAQQLWPNLTLDRNLAQNPITQGFWRLLEQVKRPDLAQLLRSRLESGQCPVLNPWQDLESAMPDRVAAEVPVETDRAFADVVEESFRSLSTLPSGTQLQRLSSIRQRMLGEEDPSQIALTLVEHLSCLVAYATGDYGQAEAFFKEAEQRWLRIGAMQRLRGDWLKTYEEGARRHQMDAFVEGLPQKLFNPFLEGVKGWRKSGSLEKQEESTDPVVAWMELLKDAWRSARDGEYSLAVRYASRSERRAKEIAADDLRVCFAINSQAIFCLHMGSYAESDALWQDCQQMYRRGAMTLTARTAWNDFCDVLEETGWLDQAERIRKCWAKPTPKPDEPPLLDPNRDVEPIQMTRLQQIPDAVGELEYEPDPVTKPTGWFKRLFGKKS